MRSPVQYYSVAVIPNRGLLATRQLLSYQYRVERKVIYISRIELPNEQLLYLYTFERSKHRYR